MGNRHIVEKEYYRGRAGKVDTPFDAKLKNVKWGEFQYDSFFKPCPVKNKLNKTNIHKNGKTPVYSSDSNNNGILGNTNNDPEFIINKDNPVYIIFGDHTRTFNIACESFCVMDNVKVLSINEALSINTLMFIIASWKKCIPNLGYSRHWSIASNVSFKLPLSEKNELDLNFMETFVHELDTLRINKLNNYLTQNNLINYKLSTKEENILNKFTSIEWSNFRLELLFEKLNTNKLPFKAEDLPKQPTKEHSLPCLTSSFNNQGLNYFVPIEGATVLKNVISIPSNSDVYRAYYQSNEFTVLSDAYAINWIIDSVKLTSNHYLFAVQSINKVTDLSIYSYKNKLGGWNVVKKKSIQLPVKDKKPDYETMNILISAIKKTIIKNVVLYVEGKTEVNSENH